MEHLGPRPRVEFPESYKQFTLLRSHGRVYAIPDFLDAIDLRRRRLFLTHPAVLSAATLDEVQTLIDCSDTYAIWPEKIGAHAGHDLIYQAGVIHGVPQCARNVDLYQDEERRRANVISGASYDEVCQRIDQLAGATPVEFAGWLPIFEYSGNCGKHPQFTHTTQSPAGYRFTCSAPPRQRTVDPRLAEHRLLNRVSRGWSACWKTVRPVFAMFFGGPRVGLRARCRVLWAVLRLCVLLLFRGAGLGAILRFLQSRHFHSQLLLANHRGLVFLTSMPYTYGQNPWLVEIEDPTTLFYPLIQNGSTCEQQVAASPYFPIVKALLESDQCKGILTHMKSTAQLVPTMFQSETIRKKVFYTPLGVKLPARWQQHEDRGEREPLHLLFINSWCQVPENLYVRGGLDILEAFSILHKRYPHLRLTMRTNLPELDNHYHRIIEEGWVRVIQRFMSAEEMADLHADSHIFLLPAARIHIVSLLQAMSYGLAVVASDGWGIEEYLQHERNGLVVKGRYGKTSWADTQAGMLREYYDPTYTADSEVVQGLVEAIGRLVEDHELRRRLGQTARHDVETKYHIDRWNQALKELFDEANGKESRIQNPESRIQSPAALIEDREEAVT